MTEAQYVEKMKKDVSSYATSGMSIDWGVTCSSKGYTVLSRNPIDINTKEGIKVHEQFSKKPALIMLQ